MTHLCQDDGITYLNGGEHWHVTGYATVKVWVSFDTDGEPGDPDDRFEDDLYAALSDVINDDFEVVESDGLELEAEEDGYYD